jgi:hypothetical protein
MEPIICWDVAVVEHQQQVVIATYARANAKTSAADVEGVFTTVSESASVSFVVTAKILSDGKP